MNVKVEELNGTYVAALQGEMDTAAALEVEETLNRILLSILKGAKAAGSRVVLRDVNDDIKNVFQLTGFINIFEFE